MGPSVSVLSVLQENVVHVHELKGWTGTKDIELYAQGQADGFELVITNDTKQLSRPLEWRPSRSRACIASSTARTDNMVAGGSGHGDRYCLRGPSSRPVRTRSS